MAHETGILKKYPGRPDAALQRSLERRKKISRGANVTFSARAEGSNNHESESDGTGRHEPKKDVRAIARRRVSGGFSAAAWAFMSGVRNDTKFKHGNMTSCGD
jgi:hypothetical protein